MSDAITIDYSAFTLLLLPPLRYFSLCDAVMLFTRLFAAYDTRHHGFFRRRRCSWREAAEMFRAASHIFVICSFMMLMMPPFAITPPLRYFFSR